MFFFTKSPQSNVDKLIDKVDDVVNYPKCFEARHKYKTKLFCALDELHDTELKDSINNLLKHNNGWTILFWYMHHLWERIKLGQYDMVHHLRMALSDIDELHMDTLSKLSNQDLWTIGYELSRIKRQGTYHLKHGIEPPPGYSNVSEVLWIMLPFLSDSDFNSFCNVTDNDEYIYNMILQNLVKLETESDNLWPPNEGEWRDIPEHDRGYIQQETLRRIREENYLLERKTHFMIKIALHICGSNIKGLANFRKFQTPSSIRQLLEEKWAATGSISGTTVSGGGTSQT